jgi:hypothetical protein
VEEDSRGGNKVDETFADECCLDGRLVSSGLCIEAADGERWDAKK